MLRRTRALNLFKKPVLKKLTARIHPLDYKIDFSAKTLRVAVLNDEWVELRLKWYNYLDKYLDGSWKPGEILISYRNGKILVYITFHRDVEPIAFKTVMGVDINFNNITYTVIHNGCYTFQRAWKSSSPKEAC